MMRTSDEIRARLHHGTQELHEALRLVAASSDRIQTALDEIQTCYSRADLIDPAINALNHQIQTLSEEMDRVYSLRNNENDLYLRQENNQLKRDIAAVQQALRREMAEHQAHLTESVKSNEELNQRIQSLERFNDLLKAKINEMKEQYESAIVDVVDLRDSNAGLRDTNAGLKDTVKSLQNTPAFNVIANTMASGDPNGGTSTGPIPFGKTVVETNRGLTVTIESSPDSSPDKASLHHGWIPQDPSGLAVPFPDFNTQPQTTSLTPGNIGSARITIRPPGRPKGRGIVKGTPEANESFERMQRMLNSSALATFTNNTGVDNNASAVSSSFTSGLVVPAIRPFDVHPVPPSKVKSKLNPAVEAFTPSISSSKDSGKSGSMQASSPSKDEVKPSVNATTTKEEGFIPPHRRFPKISIEEGPLTTTDELSVKEKIKDQAITAMKTQKKSTKEAEPLETTSLTPRVLPHLRRRSNVTQRGDVDPSHVQWSAKGKEKEGTVEGTELRDSALADMKENVKAATTPGVFVKPDPGLEAWLDSQEKSHSNDASANDPASLINDMLIEIDPDDSPKAGENKTVPLPPGFIPISTKEAPVKTDTAAPIKTDPAASPTAAHDRVTYRNPTAKNEGAAPGQEVSAKTASEKEKNAAFVAEYNRKLSSVSEKYGRDSRKGSDAKEDGVDPIKYEGADPSYVPSLPSGTHELGALLDDECYGMVLKPRKAVKVVEGAGQEWKAVQKDGKVVYVL